MIFSLFFERKIGCDELMHQNAVAGASSYVSGESVNLIYNMPNWIQKRNGQRLGNVFLFVFRAQLPDSSCWVWKSGSYRCCFLKLFQVESLGPKHGKANSTPFEVGQS